MFNFEISAPSVKDAFNMLASQVRLLDWFEKNNRPYRLDYYKKLNNPLINEMISDRHMDKGLFYDKYLNLFQKELYKKQFYADRILQAKQAVLKLQPCYERYEKLQKSWGFEILPRYFIDINLYGTGGSYHKDKEGNGHIMIGEQKSIDRLAFILGHEILHLGIEDLIVNPEHKEKPQIQQEEKERIVDNLCIYAMDGVLPLIRKWKNGQESKYQEVAVSADYMDVVVGNQPEDNLVSSVRNFLSEKINARR